jgi:hypothetical protein
MQKSMGIDNIVLVRDASKAIRPAFFFASASAVLRHEWRRSPGAD